MRCINKAASRIAAITAILMVIAMGNYSFSPMVSYAASQRKGIVAANALNVRSGPGLNYSIRDVIDHGDTVVIVETNKNGWHKIKLGKDQYGWVSGNNQKDNYHHQSQKQSEQRGSRKRHYPSDRQLYESEKGKRLRLFRHQEALQKD